MSDAHTVTPQPEAAGSPQTIQKVQRTEAEWRQALTPEQYYVLREKGTERAFTGHLVNNHADGIYHCAACDAPLFKSETKFESGSGWPSFFEPISPTAVELHEDRTYGMRRVEDLRHLWRPSRPRISRRAKPDRRALLHELGQPGLQEQVIQLKPTSKREKAPAARWPRGFCH